jgi:hypothetical protein
MDWSELITTLASAVTAIGVLLAWWQIRLAKQQATTQFEDTIAREYREIALRLPVKALLEEQLDDKQHNEELENFYHYIDLTTEEIFLRQQNRIGFQTWSNWRDGIKSNLTKPAFKKAWEEIKRRAPDNFYELRRLEQSEFKDDPREWR